MATQVSSLKAKKISQLDDYSINDGLSSNIDESIYLILAHSNNNENINNVIIICKVFGKYTPNLFSNILG